MHNIHPSSPSLPSLAPSLPSPPRKVCPPIARVFFHDIHTPIMYHYDIHTPTCLSLSCLKTSELQAKVDGTHYLFRDVVFKLVAAVSDGVVAITTPSYPPTGYTPPAGMHLAGFYRIQHRGFLLPCVSSVVISAKQFYTTILVRELC